MRLATARLVCAAALLVLGAAESAWAFAHLYVVSEVYSSVDGKVQFIELRNASATANSEIFWAGSSITVTNAGGTMMHTFTFPANLPTGSGGTVGTRVLLATEKFKMLSGAPAPDYVIPEGFLFQGGGTIVFSPNGSSVPYGALPTDGQTSINFPGGNAPNTPKNYKQGGMSGVQGSVNAPGGACCMGTDCTVMTEIGCEGDWTLGGSCSPSNPCLPATGACCRAVTCAVTIAADCSGPNTVYVSGSPDCNAAGVNTTPCCRADFNKTGGISVQDIFDYLGAWFAGSTSADFTGNGAGMPTVQSIFDYLAAWFTGGC